MEEEETYFFNIFSFLFPRLVFSDGRRRRDFVGYKEFFCGFFENVSNF